MGKEIFLLAALIFQRETSLESILHVLSHWKVYIGYDLAFGDILQHKMDAGVCTAML